MKETCNYCGSKLNPPQVGYVYLTEGNEKYLVYDKAVYANRISEDYFAVRIDDKTTPYKALRFNSKGQAGYGKWPLLLDTAKKWEPQVLEEPE